MDIDGWLRGIDLDQYAQTFREAQKAKQPYAIAMRDGNPFGLESSADRGWSGLSARVVPIDAWYGVIAALILIVGFSRAIFAAKGWAYYAHNAFFWAKIGTFKVIALISVPPTLAFLMLLRVGISIRYCQNGLISTSAA